MGDGRKLSAKRERSESCDEELPQKHVIAALKTVANATPFITLKTGARS